MVVRKLKDNEEDKKMRFFGNLSYASYLQTRNEKQAYIHKLSKDNDIYKNWTVLSNKDADTFWINRETKTIIHSIRGTDIKNTHNSRNKDILADIALSFGLKKIMSRYRKSENAVKITQREYKPEEGWTYHWTGHSLGASVAGDLALEYGNEETHAFLFNQGAPSVPISMDYTNLMSHPSIDKKREKVHNYITVGDVISNSGFFDVTQQNILVPKKESENVHSISNFI